MMPYKNLSNVVDVGSQVIIPTPLSIINGSESMARAADKKVNTPSLPLIFRTIIPWIQYSLAITQIIDLNESGRLLCGIIVLNIFHVGDVIRVEFNNLVDSFPWPWFLSGVTLSTNMHIFVILSLAPSPQIVRIPPAYPSNLPLAGLMFSCTVAFFYSASPFGPPFHPIIRRFDWPASLSSASFCVTSLRLPSCRDTFSNHCKRMEDTFLLNAVPNSPTVPWNISGNTIGVVAYESDEYLAWVSAIIFTRVYRYFSCSDS
jgi:hypothetical protein